MFHPASLLFKLAMHELRERAVTDSGAKKI